MIDLSASNLGKYKNKLLFGKFYVKNFHCGNNNLKILKIRYQKLDDSEKFFKQNLFMYDNGRSLFGHGNGPPACFSVSRIYSFLKILQRIIKKIQQENKILENSSLQKFEF